MAHLKLTQHRSMGQMKAVLARAAIVATILGTGLTVANQCDAVFGPADLQWLPLILVYFTPFVVVSTSQVMGAQAAARAKGWQGEQHERFLMTLFSHGIIRRAVMLGLAIGLINIGIVFAASVIAGRQLDQLPIALLLQAVTLPVIFGALSQSLSFRRAVGSTTVTLGRNTL